jgi:hypothetical protein
MGAALGSRIGASRAVSVNGLCRSYSELGEWRSKRTLLRRQSRSTCFLFSGSDQKREVTSLGTFQLPARLAGSEGANRSPAFCFISARSDLKQSSVSRARYAGQTAYTACIYQGIGTLRPLVLLSRLKPMSSSWLTTAKRTRVRRSPFRSLWALPVKTSKRWRPFT